jgi:GTP-binding protein Era
VTEPTPNLETRAGFVAVIGAPNAGKSTLVNHLVGAKVSIVTQKVQTTRFPVRGVAIEGAVQMVLVDTPGIFKPKRRLDRAMVASAWGGAEDADAVVHLVDVQAEIAVKGADATPADRRSVDDVEAIVERLKTVGARAILALNKIDGLKRENMLAIADALFSTGVYDQVFMISALKGSGVNDLRAELAKRMPPGPWLYPEDQIADAPERVLAAEITREKLYLRVHEELPYAAAVETTEFKELKDGSVRIEQTIYVERDGQRAIIIGKDGQTLKWIGQHAREELDTLLGRKTHLFLHVKVNDRWQDDRALYAQFGLNFDA